MRLATNFLYASLSVVGSCVMAVSASSARFCIILIHTRMTQLKIVKPSRGSIHKYENLKSKLYKCTANLHFNRECLKQGLTPAYANINIPNISPAHKHNQRKVPNITIKDEMKYLCIKKQKLTQEIYYLHIALANSWNSSWPYIQQTVEETVQMEAQRKYKTLSSKLNKLTKAQTKTPKVQHMFHPRVINNSDIVFNDNETNLLQKGLKYNTHTKHKNCLQNLALEAETAITQLPTTERDAYRKIVAKRIKTLQ
jgi:hypothetical protein